MAEFDCYSFIENEYCSISFGENVFLRYFKFLSSVYSSTKKADMGV